MSERATAWLTVIAAVGMIFGLIGSDLKLWPDWSLTFHPKTIGQLLLHLSQVIAAFTGGVLYQRRAPGAGTTDRSN